MATVFHEKQEGRLCAVHCLNAVLQGSYFTPVDLGSIAKELDEAESKLRYDRKDVDFSFNMDDSGSFSIQVITKALEVWNLELIPLRSSEPRARVALENPTDMQAFICHYKDHWFAIRKINGVWYDLNSLLSSPQVINESKLNYFLNKLKESGYLIFLIYGELPNTIDNLPPAKVESNNNIVADTKSYEDNMPKLRPPRATPPEGAVVVPRAMLPKTSTNMNNEDDDVANLRKAMALSLSCHEDIPQPENTEIDYEALNNYFPSTPEEREIFYKAVSMSLENLPIESNVSGRASWHKRKRT